MSDVITRLRTKRKKRSKLRRLLCGLAQACVGMLLAANATLIYFYKAYAWFAFVGVWSGAMAFIAGVSGIIVHLSETRCCKKFMFVVNLINIFAIYPALIVIGIAFYITDGYSLVYFRHFNKVLNLFYMVFAFFGMITAVVEVSVVRTNNERQHILSFDIRKRCGLDRGAARHEPEVTRTMPDPEPVPSTSTAPKDVHVATISIENELSTFSDYENEGFVNHETECTHL